MPDGKDREIIIESPLNFFVRKIMLTSVIKKKSYVVLRIIRYRK